MHNWLKQIKLITWDLDGTLYPSNPDFSAEIEKRKFSAVAKYLNCSLDEAKEKFDEILSETRSHTRTLDALGIDGTQFFVNVWQKIALNEYIQKNPELVNLFEKVNHIPHAMLTNSNSRENIHRKLSLVGLDMEIFSFIITSVEAGYKKPSPEIFEMLIERSQLPPHQILYAGDREKTDILPAKKLGIKTCIVGSDSTEADVVVKNANELLQMFV